MSKSKVKIKEVGGISNYYGCLSVKQSENKFYWSIEDWNGHDWEEITKDLYNSLLRFEKEREEAKR